MARCRFGNRGAGHMGDDPPICLCKLASMADPYVHIPVGTQATCMGVDDAGNILASWDCGSSLSIAYGADRAHRVASDAEIKVSLDWLGKRQRKAAEGGHCPRCGKRLDSFERHALSRYADVIVCDECYPRKTVIQGNMVRRL